MWLSLLSRVEGWNKAFWAATAIALIAVIGLLDYLTGSEFAFSLFYVLPISMLAWFGGRRLGTAASFLAALVWLLAEIGAGQRYSQTVVYVWNTGVRLGFFVLVTVLLAALRASLERARAMARLDSLTGALSAPAFYRQLQAEIVRSSRYQRPFTLAYLDLDDFKTVNDRFGHSAGDELLRAFVIHARDRLRRTDTLARMGGDEFAILFLETDARAAHAAITGLRAALGVEMRSQQWPGSLSIGVVTFTAPPESADEAVRLADELMYAAKRGGKDAARFATYNGADSALVPEPLSSDP
jgi:diguanylate cyclase (GGDEF)-like protein